MKDNKNITFSIFIVLIISVIVVIVSNNSFAYEYTINNYTLFYKDDLNELGKDITVYLDSIDDYLIPNSSYLYSDILVENYDFLTNFALDYIINNKEAYIDKIIKLDDYTYYDSHYNELNTNEYIDIEEIYDITYKYFGIKDYSIINDNVSIINNCVSLSDYTERLFSSQVKNLDVDKNKDMIIATVSYDSGDRYKYTFKIINNVLKIYNIEVV